MQQIRADLADGKELPELTAEIISTRHILQSKRFLKSRSRVDIHNPAKASIPSHAMNPDQPPWFSSSLEKAPWPS